ncbi:leucine-rich repeat-containing protein let-4 [Ixodes scapularis]|uniref:leucine-rich repeat-containing protein let-4 n=1 Tax=Ixodes scapularis TaxID=6945 RepID=UPI001A9D2372|nr:leucine-rich repeat-containing protein let-4 [Ixodes scapularis]
MAAQVTGLNSSKLLAADCPQLSHCVCGQYARYIRIYCSTHVNFSLNFGDISSDLVKLPGLKIKKLIINRVNETVLPSNFLANLTITNLVINDDRLEFIADEAFVGVLKLTNLIVLTTQLKSVPHAVSFLGPKLINLEMTNNRIEKVDDVLNKLINLEILNLENNRIVSLDDNLFANLIQLRELRLGNNMIEHLPTSLSRAKHLVFMDLHNNNIKDLHVYGNNISDVTTIFTRGINPEIVRIERNPITELPKRLVWSNMKEFHAQQCHISIVNPGAFQMLSQLRLLDLSENQISDLNNTVFSQSSKLATFSAASNLIKNVDNIFNKTRWLQVINLDSNFIEDITNAFTGLFLLNRLRLKQNEISFIRDKTFNSNKDLKYLDLSQNEIEWLGTNCFKGLVRLDHLDLGKNKLLCTERAFQTQ